MYADVLLLLGIPDATLLAVKIPKIFTSPITSSFTFGFVEPMPTNPLEDEVNIVPPDPTTILEAVIIPVVFILIVELTLLDVVAVPVKLPTKLEAVIIPVVFILIVELTLLDVVAVPVKLPTKLEAVIIPVVLMLEVVPKPTAVDAVPVKLPTKLEAVIIPLTEIFPSI
jgi:hypothetical protein